MRRLPSGLVPWCTRNSRRWTVGRRAPPGLAAPWSGLYALRGQGRIQRQVMPLPVSDMSGHRLPERGALLFAKQCHGTPGGVQRCGLKARCAPLVRLLLLSDPGSWCSGTGRGLRQLPRLFYRARRRRWARAAGRGAARQPPWAAGGWGRRRPDAPLWCGCFSSLTSVLGAAALPRKHLGHLNRLCSAHGVVAGHGQRGVEQHESPHGRCRWELS